MRALRSAAFTSAFFLAAAASLAQAPMADRIVAERVLRLGGAVILSGQRVPIRDLDDLPDGDFRIQTLDLVGVSMGAWGLKDELSRLPPLPHLKDRKSTRLNSSHLGISYAVFCLKKKKCTR